MRSTEIDRRRFAALLGGGLLTGAGPAFPGGVAQAEARQTLFLGARKDAADGFRVAGFDAGGRVRFDLPIPARGHAFAVDPRHATAVHFARRPGRWAVAIDLRVGTAKARLSTPDDRHFYGHGAFSPDGRLLYTAENDFAAARGAIGVWDAAGGFRRVGELLSHDIGPHQIALMPDGTTLAVANGGIATRPDMPRVKLNVPSMAPSLTFVDRRDGRLLRRIRLAPELHKCGIRHLSVAGRGGAGRVAIGVQYEGPTGDTVPLVGIADPGAEEVRLFEGPAEPLRAMRHYCGSVEFDASGRFVAASSPRGGVVTIWDAEDGAHLRTVAIEDGCGIAPDRRPGRFVVSDGTGGLFMLDAATGRARPLEDWRPSGSAWDNHLAALRL